MKEYEVVTQNKLMKNTPVIIRLDGVAFHTFTKGLTKPFDIYVSNAFEYTCRKLKEKVPGAKFIYSQSDEISILITNWETDENNETKIQDTWYDYRIQKIISVISAYATKFFNEYMYEIVSEFKLDYENKYEDIIKYENKLFGAAFDARVFNLPISEVCNYFIYRQKDAMRNSKQSLAQAYFSHKELHNKNTTKILEMLNKQFNIDYFQLPLIQQRGFCIYKDTKENSIILDENIPEFTEDRDYINKFLK